MKSRIERNLDKQKKIEKEKHNETVKKVIKKTVKAIIITFIIVFLSCLYIIKIGTVKITVNEQMIINEKISDSMIGLKVIQFSDLHYENHNILKSAVEKINIRKPDLVLFTGDLLKENTDLSPKKREKLVKELQKINANLGKYAVLGESDNNEAISILLDANFQILDDSNELIYNESNNPIMLVGLNTNNKELNIERAFANYNENIYTILMLHKPDYIDTITTNYKIDLALAGHSHLGEINIPYFYSKKDYAEKYTKSYYELENIKFYISSGLGTSNYDVRINARSSINFFRFRKTV